MSSSERIFSGLFFCQELSRFSLLLRLVCQSLEQLQLAIKGLVASSSETDALVEAINRNLVGLLVGKIACFCFHHLRLDSQVPSVRHFQVPSSWAAVSYPSLKPLGSWSDDLQRRVAFVSLCANNDESSTGLGSPTRPPSYWLSAFFHPRGFLTAVLQRAARQQEVAIDKLQFAFAFSEVSDPRWVRSAVPVVRLFAAALQTQMINSSLVGTARLSLECFLCLLMWLQAAEIYSER